jgi:hypothetical protein
MMMMMGMRMKMIHSDIEICYYDELSCAR